MALSETVRGRGEAEVEQIEDGNGRERVSAQAAVKIALSAGVSGHLSTHLSEERGEQG